MKEMYEDITDKPISAALGQVYKARLREVGGGCY